MELYILDSLLRRTSIVEEYKSLIWTERFREAGDFQLDIQSTPANRAELTAETRLGLKGSRRVMVVETIEDSVDDDGRAMLKVTGPTLEKVLKDRAAIGGVIDTWTSTPTWAITGTPGAVARQIFQNVCVTGSLSLKDIIPFYEAGSTYPADTVVEPVTTTTIDVELSSVYDALVEICDTYDLGFRLYKGPDDSKLYFNVYAGVNRTSSQTLYPAIIFSPAMNNLANVTELSSTVLYKNVIYIYSSQAAVSVFSADEPEPSGFDRRVQLVNSSFTVPVPLTAQETDAKLKETRASNLESNAVTPAEITAAEASRAIADAARVVADAANASAAAIIARPLLAEIGALELAKHRKVRVFDGAIPQDGKYEYEKDYYLGDLVEMRNIYGAANDMRVTEQLFVSDDEGDRSYPTLSTNLSITPGAWFSWDYNQVWDDAVGDWQDQI